MSTPISSSSSSVLATGTTTPLSSSLSSSPGSSSVVSTNDKSVPAPSHIQLNPAALHISSPTNADLLTKLEYFRVRPRWLFVRIESSGGFVGWGEATLEGHTEAVEGALGALRETFLGWPTDGIVSPSFFPSSSTPSMARLNSR